MTMEVTFECLTTSESCNVDINMDCTVAQLRRHAKQSLRPTAGASVEATLYRSLYGGREEFVNDKALVFDVIYSGDTVLVSFELSSKWASPASYPCRSLASDLCGNWIGFGVAGVGILNLENGEQINFDSTSFVRDRCLVLTTTHIVFSSNTALIFVNRKTGKPTTRIPHNMDVQMLSAMPNGKEVAVGTKNQISIYSNAGEFFRELDCCGESFAVSPCGAMIFQNNNPDMLIVDPQTGDGLVRLRMTHHRSLNLKPQFSPNSKFILCSTEGEDRVRVGNTSTGELVCAIARGSSTIHAACFSACSRYLFTSTEFVFQWDTHNGRCVSKIPVENNSLVRFLAASEDGKKLVVSGNAVNVIVIPEKFQGMGGQVVEKKKKKGVDKKVQGQGQRQAPVQAKDAGCSCVCS